MQEQETKIIYFNTKEGFGVELNSILPGWEVVNAPRPIPGTLTWQGKFRHGIYYAAGLRSEFGKTWDYLDAYPCRLISNEEITDKAKLFCQKYKKNLETCGVPIHEIAKMMKLPFVAD